MSSLQKIALGTPPTAVDGDTVRGANTKMNSNVDVLNTQTVLTSNAAVITAAQALTVAHVGKRVNINLAAAGTINLPAASTCTADNVIHLRNVGATLVTLAITAGSGDTVALTTLAAGESAIMDTDGVHAWTCALRGRSNSANESVQGNLSVGGILTRAGNAVWDAGNLTAAKIATFVDTTATAQTKTGRLGLVAAGGVGNYQTGQLQIDGGTGTGSIGMASNSAAGVAVWRVNPTSGNSEFVNYAGSGYTNIVCQTLSQASDEAIKDNVKTLDNVMSRLRNKRGVSYQLKTDGSAQIGVIAQDWVNDFPELIEQGMNMTADGAGVDGDIGPPKGPIRTMLGFKYMNAVGVILQGLIETDSLLQSAVATIHSLQARISVLESK